MNKTSAKGKTTGFSRFGRTNFRVTKKQILFSTLLISFGLLGLGGLWFQSRYQFDNKMSINSFFAEFGIDRLGASQFGRFICSASILLATIYYASKMLALHITLWDAPDRFLYFSLKKFRSPTSLRSRGSCCSRMIK